MEPTTLLVGIVYPLKAIAWTAYLAIALVIDVPVSYLGGLIEEGGEIAEPIHIVSGLRYGSIKFDIPYHDEAFRNNCWYYAGDEPERSGDVDENTYAFRCSGKFEDTVNLRGDETRP